jgi:spore coat polysaccharide biosynthesis protein SpsF
MPSKRSCTKKVGIIVQARMGSTRLPGKVLRIVDSKPLLQILLGRLKRVKPCDIIIVATTVDPKDDPIEQLCKELRIPVFRGSEQDVLSRYYLAAKKHDLDVVVRITGDCPVMDPKVVGLLYRTIPSYQQKAHPRLCFQHTDTVVSSRNGCRGVQLQSPKDRVQ